MKKIFDSNLLLLTLLLQPLAVFSAVYTVTNTNNSGAGSLRQAMLDANATPDADVIAFNIGGGGAHTIDGNFPASVLGSDVTVDGTTQPGYSGTPLITILKFSGTAVFTVQGENVWIKGLSFDGNNSSPGILASGTWSNLKVEDCRFINVPYGVAAFNGSDVKIINCHFDIFAAGNNIAVSLQGITENVIPKGVQAYGNTFNMEYGSQLPYFYSLYQMEAGLLIGNQTVSGANITIEDGAGFADSPAGCATVLECHGIVFDHLQLVKTGDAGEQGLLFNSCTDVTVQSCAFSNLNSALVFWPCQDVRILNNTFTDCGKGGEVFLNIIITDLGSNLLPNGLLMSGNQFSNIGRGIGITVDDGAGMVIGSPVTPGANIMLTEDDGHDDIETDVVYCGYEAGFGGAGNYTIRDLDFTGKGAMTGTGVSFLNGSAIGLVEYCRISNFEFGVAFYEANVTVRCNLLYENATGVVRYGDEDALVENNAFAGNLLAIDNSQFTSTQLNAENNYWGGGLPVLNGPNGYAGDVDVSPYVAVPPGCAPTLPNSEYVISGALLWEHDDVSGVGNATVALTGDQSGSVVTSADGTYSFTVTSGSNFAITPAKTINKFNGVTVADAVAIQKHVVGVMPITDPYKIVAADVNKNQSVSTLDATIIVQSLAGNPAAIANFKTSWRFVPTAHTMTVPPWGFPENISLTGVNSHVSSQDFYGMKTGDIVSPHANPANFGPEQPLVLNVHDQVLQRGATVEVVFTANQRSDLTAFQLAVQFDVDKLQLAEITPLDGLPLTTDNFGTYNVSEGNIRLVWAQATGMFLGEAAPVFALKFKVLQEGGKLSEAIGLDETTLPALAYDNALTESGVVLNFRETTGTSDFAGAGLQLFQNQPNPFNGKTAISFMLPRESEVQLRVIDATGRVWFSQTKNYPAGRNEERLELESASGVLWYELTTPFGNLTRRMLAKQPR